MSHQQRMARDTDKLIAKITKLTRMTEERGATEAEAAACAEKAQVLLMSANLTMAEVEEHERNGRLGGVGETIVDEMGSLITWKSILLNGVAEAYLCKHYTVSYGRTRWQSRHGVKKRTQFALLGREANVTVAREMYRYLMTAIEQLAKKQKVIFSESDDADYIAPKRYLHAYRIGCASRVIDRLQEKTKEMRRDGIEDDGATCALVVHAEARATAEIADFLRQAGINPRKSRPTACDEEGLIDGFRSGDDIGLDPQIDSGKRTQPALPRSS